jgi:hypothetical protein
MTGLTDLAKEPTDLEYKVKLFQMPVYIIAYIFILKSTTGN